MERQKGPIVIDNIGIPTSKGIVDVVVDQKAFREYIIKEAGIPESDEPDSLDKIDQLVIAFGKRSYRDVLAEHLTKSYLRTGLTEEKALRLGRREATAVDIIGRLLQMGHPHVALFQASDEYPFLYFNLPYFLRRKEGNEEFSDSWVHELNHLSDYLNPKRK